MSLEEEIRAELQRAAEATMLEPRVTGRDVEMSTEAVIATVLIPMIEAQRQAIVRLAQEVDRLRS